MGPKFFGSTFCNLRPIFYIIQWFRKKLNNSIKKISKISKKFEIFEFVRRQHPQKSCSIFVFDQSTWSPGCVLYVHCGPYSNLHGTRFPGRFLRKNLENFKKNRDFRVCKAPAPPKIMFDFRVRPIYVIPWMYFTFPLRPKFKPRLYQISWPVFDKKSRKFQKNLNLKWKFWKKYWLYAYGVNTKNNQ